MKQQLIQSLLDKYFAGESSLQEEAQLRQLIQEEPLSEAQKPYKAWFELLDQEVESVELGADFEAKIMQQIESRPGVVPTIRKLQISWILRIAAVFALVASGMWWITRSNVLVTPQVAEAKVIDWSKYEPKTAEEAYEVTRKALHRVADELNAGTAIARDGMDKMEEMGKVFN